MNKNIETFINTIKINDDICIANASIHQLEYTIIYMVELVDIKKFDLQIKPLITKESFNHLSDLFGGLCKNISDISTTNLEFLLYSGKILVFFDSYFYSFEFSNKPKRSISTSKIDPEDPMASQDGLIEDLNVNLTLIKRRLKTSDLRVNKYQLGLISKTECAILYLQSSYDKYSLELVLSKLRTMKNEIVTSIDDINILYDNNSLLPQIFNTSSPEIIVDSLVNGRIVILLDNTQVATILPANLSTFTVSKSYVNTPRFFSIFNHILISLFSFYRFL